MNAERKPVDVPAALDRAHARAMERGAAKGSPVDVELREARAAVAGLIAAAEALAPRYCNMTTVAGRNEMSRRLEAMRAALARCGVQS